MKLVDLNLLLYAVNRDSPNHSLALVWWEKILSEDEPVGLAWIVLLGFIRITTHSRIMPRPLSPEQAFAIVDEWLQQPIVQIVTPTERHWEIFKNLLKPLGTAGNLTSDAHLAAVAIENGAELYTTDHDFGRFPHLRWKDPLSARRSKI